MREREQIERDIECIQKQVLKTYNKRLIDLAKDKMQIELNSFIIEQLSIMSDENREYYLLAFNNFLEMHYELLLTEIAKQLFTMYEEYCKKFNVSEKNGNTLSATLYRIDQKKEFWSRYSFKCAVVHP